jgi:hypothetical protein
MGVSTDKTQTITDIVEGSLWDWRRVGREESFVRGMDHFGRFRTEDTSPEGGSEEMVVSRDKYDSS